MFNALKKVARKKNIMHIYLYFFCAMVWASGIFYTDVKDQFKAMFEEPEPLEISDNTTRDYYNKWNVIYEAPCILDYYASYKWRDTIPNFKIATRLYPAVIWTSDSNTPKLITIEVPFYKYGKAQKIAKSTLRHLQAREEKADTSLYSAKGSIRILLADEKKLFVECYGDAGVKIFPYVITDGQIGESLFFNIFLIFFPVAFLWLMISEILGYKKAGDEILIKEEFEEAYSADSFEDAVLDCEHGRIINDIFIGEKYIAFDADRVKILKISDLLWVYKRESAYLGVIKYKSRIVFNTVDGESYEVIIKKYGFEEVCDTMNKTDAEIVWGYSGKLRKLYNKNRNVFIEMAKKSQIVDSSELNSKIKIKL